MSFETKKRSFSFPEFILVIAILAALAAIIGIQVLPPLERAKEARDKQLIESYLTAAAEAPAFSENGSGESGMLGIDIYTGSYAAGTAEAKLQKEIRGISGYDTIEAFRNAALSGRGKRITDIRITIDSGAGIIKVQAVNGGEQVFDEVENAF